MDFKSKKSSMKHYNLHAGKVTLFKITTFLPEFSNNFKNVISNFILEFELSIVFFYFEKMLEKRNKKIVECMKYWIAKCWDHGG